MQLRIGSLAPDFAAWTTTGPIRFHDWIGGDWCILFSHPKDFTPVCTTELGRMAALEQAFHVRDCKIIGLGADPVESHLDWAKDIADVCGHPLQYPVIATPISKSRNSTAYFRPTRPSTARRGRWRRTPRSVRCS